MANDKIQEKNIRMIKYKLNRSSDDIYMRIKRFH